MLYNIRSVIYYGYPDQSKFNASAVRLPSGSVYVSPRETVDGATLQDQAGWSKLHDGASQFDIYPQLSITPTPIAAFESLSTPDPQAVALMTRSNRRTMADPAEFARQASLRRDMTLWGIHYNDGPTKETERLIGLCTLSQERADVPEVWDLGIALFSSAEQGRGIGTQVVSALARLAFAAGCKGLYANPRVMNQPMVAVLDKVGFVCLDRQPVQPDVERPEKPTIRMLFGRTSDVAPIIHKLYQGFDDDRIPVIEAAAAVSMEIFESQQAKLDIKSSG